MSGSSGTYSIPRPRLAIDYQEGDITVFDTARFKPTQRTRAIKRSKRRLAEAEEWIDFIRKKSGDI